MAGYTPNYGAGAPGKSAPTHPSYYDYMSSTFLDHFDGLPAGPKLNAGEEPPRPLDSDKYFDDYDSKPVQHVRAAGGGILHQQQGHSPITLQRAKDSHKFFSRWTAYFHVNFEAAFDGGHGPCYTFFAEVNGPGIPESVTAVIQFHTKEEGRTRDNCLYCTGVSHPEQGGFVGHHRLPHHQDPAAGDGSEEDGGGDDDKDDADGEDVEEEDGEDDAEEEEEEDDDGCSRSDDSDDNEGKEEEGDSDEDGSENGN